MGIALILCWGIAIINYVGVAFGLGQHAKDVGKTHIRYYLIDLYSYLLVQTLAVTVIKFAILLFYYRLFSTKKFRTAVYWVSGIVAASFTFAFFGFAFECTPVNTFWGDSDGHCINGHIFRMFASGSFVLTDILIYVLPLPIVWHLHTTRRRKIELSLVFFLGGVVCITGIVRLVTLWAIDLKDITWSNVAAALWNVIEAELGFVAGNVPLMGPLFGKLRRHKGSSGTGDPTSSGRAGLGTASVHSNKQIFRNKGQYPPGDGFERMNDDHRGRLFTLAAPTGKSTMDNIEMIGVPMHSIKVQTDLEQNVGSRDDSPSVSWEQPKAY
ncbi:hypothetical protein ACLMJK_005304 [Lecanora helva]